MYTRSFVLFPYGSAEGVVKTSEAMIHAHDFCVRSAIACCEWPAAILSNKTHHLNDFFPLLEERKREICSPQTQVVIFLTISQPINSVLNAQKRLVANYPSFGEAMWVVYVNDFAETFRNSASRCGEKITEDLSSFPTWKTRDYGSFSILTPQLEDPAYITLSARRYWRNQSPQVHVVAQRPGSILRLNAVRSQSSRSSSSFPAIPPPPPDSSNKKP